MFHRKPYVLAKLHDQYFQAPKKILQIIILQGNMVVWEGNIAEVPQLTM